jgi:hypothetical protein
MSDTKDLLLLTGLNLLDHLDTFVDRSSHRFLAKDVVSLLCECFDQGCVELVLFISSS